LQGATCRSVISIPFEADQPIGRADIPVFLPYCAPDACMLKMSHSLIFFAQKALLDTIINEVIVDHFDKMKNLGGRNAVS
jgi:hypothetical protein